jgi:NAD(P)H-hydrate epimerase
MATGGSGDVLSGIIGGINAFSKSPFILNAACGAYISGVAGEIAAKEKNQYSMLASDTINNIPKAINQIIN